MINLHEDQILHLSQNIFPPLSGKRCHESELFLQERDSRLFHHWLDKMHASNLDPKLCTLDLRQRSIIELNAPAENKAAKEMVDLVGKLREWGIVTGSNEHLPLISILFNWTVDSVNYASLNSPNNESLNSAAQKIMQGLDRLSANNKDYQYFYRMTLEAIDSVAKTIEECIPEEEGRAEGYSVRYRKIIEKIDNGHKRWILESSPWMIERADNQSAAPFTSNKVGHLLLYRCFPIARSQFETLVVEYCLVVLKAWKLSASQAFAYFREIQVNGLSARIKDNPILDRVPPDMREQFVKLAQSVTELNDLFRDHHLSAVHILETLAASQKLGDPATVSLLNPLGNIIKSMLRKSIEIQELYNVVFKVQDSVLRLGLGVGKVPFDGHFQMGFIMLASAISTLNNHIAILFSWHIAAEQQPLRILSEEDKHEFLPPGLRPKSAAQTKSKGASLAKKKVKVVTAPKKRERQPKSQPSLKKQISKPKPSGPAPTPKLLEKNAALPLSQRDFTPEQLQLVRDGSTPTLIIPRELNAVEQDNGHIYQRPFTALLQGKDAYGNKVASHADLNYNLLRGLSMLNGKTSPQRLDELLFISKTAMHTANLFMEAGIKHARFKDGDAANDTSHNLWPLFKKLNIASGKETIQRHYVGSYWARFTREQLQGWASSNKRPPKLLRKLVELSDGSPEALAKANRRAFKWIEESIAFNNGLIKEALGGSPTLSVYKIEHVQTPPKNSSMENPWLSLMEEVEKLADGGNVWVKQWLDELSALSGAWRLIDEANTPAEHAVMASALHGLLHAVVQAPLYAMLVAEIGESTPEHRLEILWKEIFGKSGKPMPPFIPTLLKQASVSFRYPFNFSEPQSELHRLQLEAIALLSVPEIGEGVAPAKGKTILKGVFAALELTSVRPLAKQKDALKTACADLSEMIKRELLPEVRKVLRP